MIRATNALTCISSLFTDNKIVKRTVLLSPKRIVGFFVLKVGCNKYLTIVTLIFYTNRGFVAKLIALCFRVTVLGSKTGLSNLDHIYISLYPSGIFDFRINTHE